MVFRIFFQPVSDILLVKGGLPSSRLIFREAPEAAGIRREQLVCENDISLRVQAEFEFRVRDDDAAA